MSKTNWPEPSMMLVTSNWANTESFSLMPINNECPFVEALYNPMAKTLAVIGKTTKDTFHMIPRLSDDGKPQPLKSGATPEEPYKKQRVSQESYTEYYIVDQKEAEEFIKNFTVNHETFDYKKVLYKETMEGASTSGVLPGPNAGKVKKGKIISLEDAK
jgi:hypothetical protein